MNNIECVVWRDGVVAKTFNFSPMVLWVRILK